MKIWGYRLKNGTVEAKIFDEKIPKGWSDSPAKLKPVKGRKNGNNA